MSKQKTKTQGENKFTYLIQKSPQNSQKNNWKNKSLLKNGWGGGKSLKTMSVVPIPQKKKLTGEGKRALINLSSSSPVIALGIVIKVQFSTK